MSRSVILLIAAVVLLLGALIAVAIAHAAYMNACVCVVNSISRAAITLALSATAGVILGFVSDDARVPHRVLLVFQSVAFIAALFFIVQHVFFVLELA